MGLHHSTDDHRFDELAPVRGDRVPQDTGKGSVSQVLRDDGERDKPLRFVCLGFESALGSSVGAFFFDDFYCLFLRMEIMKLKTWTVVGNLNGKSNYQKNKR